MIITSDEKYEPGTVVTRSTQDGDIHYPPQPLFVVRECTREEWLDFCFARFGEPVSSEGLHVLTSRGYRFYYEISTD